MITKLSRVARLGDFKAVKFLLEEGADIEAIDNFGRTALMWATSWGHLKIAKFLIDKGADVNATDNDGRTVLCISDERRSASWGI